MHYINLPLASFDGDVRFKRLTDWHFLWKTQKYHYVHFVAGYVIAVQCSSRQLYIFFLITTLVIFEQFFSNRLDFVDYSITRNVIWLKMYFSRRVHVFRECFVRWKNLIELKDNSMNAKMVIIFVLIS